MNPTILKNGLNGCLDNMFREIPRKTIRVYGEDNWPQVNALLKEWEDKGYLKILRNPETALDDEVCVEMLAYIEQKSPWPNWP